MINQSFTNIFRNASKTYFYSSLFFPPAVRDKVTILYAFVRTADDFVDQTEPDTQGLHKFIECTWCTWERLELNQSLDSSAEYLWQDLINQFVKLAIKNNIKKNWVAAFFEAMTWDIQPRHIANLNQAIQYMHGSAEVIGLMMNRVLQLPAYLDYFALMQGRSMQYCNFIRDIAEDASWGRQYLPKTELAKYGLSNLSQLEAELKPAQFASFVRAQIRLYSAWQSQADRGLARLPARYRLPITTASQLYSWALQVIYDNPQIVWHRKVKPSIARVFWTSIRVWLRSY